jgi:SAM-dependent methyltransferase
LCKATRTTPWATENGFDAVKCAECGLIYVNPRPSLDIIDQAVRAGAHTEESLALDVTARRTPRNVARYKRLIGQMFADVMAKDQPISWLDVGAGYGEVVEAVTQIAPGGSRVAGIEPMKPKVDWAKAHGLQVQQGYLSDVKDKYGFASVMNVFSHIPDFHAFLSEIKRVLAPNGEVLIETGNVADIGDRRLFPNELALPDHLVFGGEAHVRRFLAEAGFAVLQVKRFRIDGAAHFAKSVVKRLMGRPVTVRLPYTSPTRTVLFRARLVS